MYLQKIGVTLLGIAGVGLFAFPVAIDWGFLDVKYFDGLMFLELGLCVFSIACLGLSSLE